VEIIQKPIRFYANNDFAGHVIGYMNKIGSELEELSKQGYTPQDLIGKSGVESSMEKSLKGTDGSRQIEVDVNGTLINTINEVDPIPGDTVFLTIDVKLQRIAEDALAKTMEDIRKGTGKDKPYPNATSGAVVAIDVNTGKILAMASEPKFDPNLFAAGISNEAWKILQPTSKDIYAPKPLINNAISATLPPGSTMKMVSAVAGLETNKITPSEMIFDKGYYTAIPGVSPSCSIFKATGRPHYNQNVSLAIKNSCNYSRAPSALRPPGRVRASTARISDSVTSSETSFLNVLSIGAEATVFSSGRNLRSELARFITRGSSRKCR
jgi:penicillin-binding protein 2